jgi:hypothetical protein
MLILYPLVLNAEILQYSSLFRTSGGLPNIIS